MEVGKLQILIFVQILDKWVVNDIPYNVFFTTNLTVI